jgi:hypothetical protein
MNAKEKVVRYMAETRPIGEWFCSHEVSGKFVRGENTGTDADTRLYSIKNDDEGIYVSNHHIYHLEHRPPRKNGNPTRYAQFRIAFKEKCPTHILGVGVLPEQQMTLV